MRVLLIHNSYQQPGGEDEVVRTEAALLRASGVEVETYFRHNDELKVRHNLVGLAADTVWSRESYRNIADLVRRSRPDVAHFHNTLPLISPSGYYACKEADVPVIQTLHNYRLLCPGANLTRNAKPCEDCTGTTFSIPAIRHGCYRDSRSATAVVAGMLATHKVMRTFDSTVDRFIALSEFSRNKFLRGGLPLNRIVVKPNCIYPDPQFSHDAPASRKYLLYLGRFSAEKGVETFAKALRSISGTIPVRLVGDGPLRDKVRELVGGLKNVTLEPWIPRQEAPDLLRGARLVVCPSECFENFPLTIAEAFGCGAPVLCSRIGVHEELVQDQVTGFHFEAGNPAELADKVERLWDSHDLLWKVIVASREKFDREFTAEQNLKQLLSIYHGAIEQRDLVQQFHTSHQLP